MLGISRNNWADVSGSATIQLEMMSRLWIRRGLGGFFLKVAAHTRNIIIKKIRFSAKEIVPIKRGHYSERDDAGDFI